MSYSLSFSEEFYSPEGVGPYECTERTDRPTTLIEAIRSMSVRDYRQACRLANIDPTTECADWELMQYARESIDSCDALSSPIGVYLDHEHTIKVQVFEPVD